MTATSMTERRRRARGIVMGSLAIGTAILFLSGRPGVGATDPCAAPGARDGDPCDDGNPCTLTDTCLGGACSGGEPRVCPPSGPCRLAGTCDPQTGACAPSPPSPNGSPCDDGDGCTRTDTCQAGQCVGADPLVCPEDAFSCTEARCRNGVCEQVFRDERCPGDGCATPACLPDSPLAEAGTGCIRTRPVPDEPRTLCAEDGDACTDDHCLGGVCAHREVADRPRCAPIQAPYVQTVALRQAGRDLAAAAAAVLRDGGPDSTRAQVERRLGDFLSDLDAVERLLAGRTPATAAGRTVAERRVRTALPVVAGLAPSLRATLRILAKGRRTGEISPSEARALSVPARELLGRVRGLERSLRRIRRFSRVFAS